MCVIMAAQTERPTQEMVEKGYESNSAGAGLAWREGGQVRWEKGLDLDEIKEYAATAPLPFILHFRIPSCGGTCQELCHPFPIEPDVPLTLTGTTNGNVLFHNGHWGLWKSMTMDVVLRKNIHVPTGKWSDTRAMALLAHHYGVGILDMIDEKTVVFGPDFIEIFGSGWSKINEVWCSNTGWQHMSHRSGGAGYVGYGGGGGYTMCRYHNCTKLRYMNSTHCFEHKHLDPAYEPEKGGGASAEATFCTGIPTARGRTPESETVSEGAAGVEARTGGKGEKEVKLLGPASPPPQPALVVHGDTTEDWRTVRRWVRSLQNRGTASDMARRRHGGEI